MNRQMQARMAAVCVLVLVTLVLAACSNGASTENGGTTPSGGSSGGGTSTGSTVISESNFAFNPVNATVKTGDSVTFENNDSAAHNVTIDGQELGVQNSGESKTWTASKDGSYPFSCVIHPAMTGRITVGDDSSAPSGGTGSGGAPPGGGSGYNY